VKYIECDKGDYTAPLDSPYGTSSALAPKIMAWHEQAHKGHKTRIVEDDK